MNKVHYSIVLGSPGAMMVVCEL